MLVIYLIHKLLPYSAYLALWGALNKKFCLSFFCHQMPLCAYFWGSLRNSPGAFDGQKMGNRGLGKSNMHRCWNNIITLLCVHCAGHMVSCENSILMWISSCGHGGYTDIRRAWHNEFSFNLNRTKIVRNLCKQTTLSIQKQIKWTYIKTI